MSVQVFVSLVLDVTVTVVTFITLVGVLVMVKLLIVLLVFVLVVNKGAAPAPSSFFAETSIVTPCGGIADVIVTVSGKSA